MGIIKRQSIKTSIVTYIGVILGAFNTLWLYPQYLDPSEIGLISLLTNIALIIAPFSQMGTNGIINKYFPYIKEDSKKLGAFVSLVILLPTIGFVVSMSLLIVGRSIVENSFAENSPLLNDFFFWLIPLIFLIVARNIAESFARVNFRITMPKLFREVVFRFLMIIVVLVYFYYNLDTDFLITALVGVFAINLILVFFYVKQLNFLSFNFSIKSLGEGFIKKSLLYGFYIILSGFAGMLVTKIDSWMIASMIDLKNTGIFTIALYIGLAIEIPKRSLNLISIPVIGRSLKEDKLHEVEDLYAKSALIQLIVGSLFFTCVWINIDDLFLLIPNSDIYSEGKYVVFFIGLAVLFDMATGVNNEIILLSDLYKWYIRIMIVLIGLAIINNQILIPIYGITGAAIATAISLFLFNIIKYLLVYIKLGIQPFSKKSLLALIVGLVIYAIGSYLPSTNEVLLNIIYKSVVICTLYYFIHQKLKTSEDLTKLSKQMFGKLKNSSKI